MVSLVETMYFMRIPVKEIYHQTLLSSVMLLIKQFWPGCVFIVTVIIYATVTVALFFADRLKIKYCDKLITQRRPSIVRNSFKLSIRWNNWVDLCWTIETWLNYMNLLRGNSMKYGSCIRNFKREEKPPLLYNSLTVQ